MAQISDIKPSLPVSPVKPDQHNKRNFSRPPRQKEKRKDEKRKDSNGSTPHIDEFA